jgi:hypothetical protein
MGPLHGEINSGDDLSVGFQGERVAAIAIPE